MLPKSRGICRYLVVLVFLMIGCVQLVSADNQTFVLNTAGVEPVIVAYYFVPNQTPIPVAPPRLSPEQEAKKQEIMREQDRLNELRKANRTFWERKIETALRSLLESDSYSKTGRISEQDMALMMTFNNVIPSDQVYAKLDVNKPTGDLFLVDIGINKSASVHIVDPYVVKVHGSEEIFHSIFCWVELSSLQDIASLESVNQIHLVARPILNNIVITATPATNPSLPNRTLGNTTGNTSPSLTQTATPVTPTESIPTTTFPTVTKIDTYSSQITVTGTTPASPLSVIGTGATLVTAVMLVLLNKRREKNL